MKTGLEITALCIDHSKADTPRIQQQIFIPFEFMLDNVISQFTDSNFEPVDYKIADYKQSIIGLIDDLIKRATLEMNDSEHPFVYFYFEGQKFILKGLKQKIEEL